MTAIVVFPQAPPGEGVDRQTVLDLVTAALDSAMRLYNTDPKRVYLTGFSMGGGVGYELAFREPTRFAAFAPVSAMIYPTGINGIEKALPGSGDAMAAAKLRTLPIWVFHGTNDRLVNISIPRNMMQAFRSAGATSFNYTEVPQS